MDIRTMTDDELRDLIEDLDRYFGEQAPFPDWRLEQLVYLAEQELGTREQLAALLAAGH